MCVCVCVYLSAANLSRSLAPYGCALCPLVIMGHNAPVSFFSVAFSRLCTYLRGSFLRSVSKIRYIRASIIQEV